MTYLPPPQPIINKDIRLSGDVEVHPTASLAQGVILQAAPGSRIVIDADVCIGMGVIVNACHGSVKIESGAILGAGVLIFGSSKIGHNCCIGTSTTIFQADVAPMLVVKPGSIIGDDTRKAVVEISNNSKPDVQSSVKSANANASKNGAARSYYSKEKSTPAEKNSSKHNSTDSIQKPTAPVVGQVYINELLMTLFPHRKDSNPKL